jgi:hypothetical protein
MAIRYYGVAVGGQGAPDVTIAASTTSSDVELAVDDTNIAVGAINKKDIIVEALQALLQAVQEDSP